MMTFRRRLLINTEKKGRDAYFRFFSSLYLNNTSFREDIDQTIITMRTDTNELNIHSLLADDIDRLRETGKAERKIFFFE
jgi:hypothetical protein